MSGEDNLFERALRKELRRGINGETDKLADNTWAQPGELGREWSYAAAHTGLLLGRRDCRLVGWSDDWHALTVDGTRIFRNEALYECGTVAALQRIRPLLEYQEACHGRGRHSCL